jgi:hypothetical protein
MCVSHRQGETLSRKGGPADMIRKIVITVVLFPLVLFLLPISTIHADDADVLPKGVMRASIENNFYFPVDEKFDDNGDEEDLAADLNGVLDNSVFPGLALVEGAFGMPSGSANIGSTIISFERDYSVHKFLFAYGITDKLTAGIEIPWMYTKNDVEARLDTSNATVGKTQIGASMGAPLAPLAGPFPDTVPLTAEDVQNFAGEGIDFDGDGTVDIEGFGYKRVENWSDSGLSDIQVGARYQYFKTKDWRLAFTGGVQIPTGEENDPDSLVDWGLGTGVWALLFRFQNDYTGIENLLLNVTLKYDLALPDEETLRVPDDVNQPITRNKEKVDRDVGDVFEFDISGTYQFLEGFSITLNYIYGYKWEDDISGDMGFRYSELEVESDYTEHIGKIGLSYSTFSLFQEKKFPVPLVASILYRNRFDGKNVNKSEYIGLNIAVFF